VKRVRTYRKTASIVVGCFLAGFVALAACSNQGEGERCDSLNGNEDCKTDQGLICYPKGQLTNTNSDRCCPADRTKATEPVCQTPVDPVGNDATAPADTGPPITPDANVSDADATAADADADSADANDE
jgi:hypothetical protein